MRARIGNLLLLGALAALCIALGIGQSEPWHRPSGDAVRWLPAFLGTLAWLLGSAWMLRRREDRSLSASTPDEEVIVAWASQTGFASQLAEDSVNSLCEAGVKARSVAIEALDLSSLSPGKRVLFIASTTGEGDPPDHAIGFIDQMQGRHELGKLDYALLALGDQRYAQFCAFGRRLDAWLAEQGAQPLFDRVEVDAGDVAALRHWQHQIVQLGNGAQVQHWVAPVDGRWHLQARSPTNPGSIGATAHHLWLVPADGSALDWQAGDIAEIGPRHSPERISTWLAASGFAGSERLTTPASRGDSTLVALLASSRLPDPAQVRGLSLQELQARLVPLPHREYSIASVPGEGTLQLLVREQHGPDGQPGLGSGWLTRSAEVGGDIDLRIRRNPTFHAPDTATPLILIGNGTGIAGLRAHLAARSEGGASSNWLLFGERQAAHDLHFGDDLRHWQANGLLDHLDLAFSRDSDDGRYVQDLVLAEAERVREWISRGAAIYVCGSLLGMAPALDEALVSILGAETVHALRRTGRYRRDVY